MIGLAVAQLLGLVLFMAVGLSDRLPPDHISVPIFLLWIGTSVALPWAVIAS